MGGIGWGEGVGTTNFWLVITQPLAVAVVRIGNQFLFDGATFVDFF